MGDDADSGVANGELLLRFVDACLGDDAASLRQAREEVIANLGGAAFVDACATVASFNAVVKIADATGIPLEEAKELRTRDFRDALGIEDYRRDR